MLLSLSTTHVPATDLGFLLMKHPDNVHQLQLSMGRASLFYPQADEARCTAAIMVEIDPIDLVRGRGHATGQQDSYVNDRPYAASSLLMTAMRRLLGTALSGRSRMRQDLADSDIPLEVTITPLPVRGPADLAARLFTPLGYEVSTTPVVLDPAHPEWGNSPYVTFTLRGRVRLSTLLRQLFLLVPVLDNSKHYYVGEDEVEKLLREGAGWLDAHPERDLIIRRALKGFRPLVARAQAELSAPDASAPADADAPDTPEWQLEAPLRLQDVRIAHVVETLRRLHAHSVLDCGCGEGDLLRALLAVPDFSRIVGMDVAPHVLARAAQRLRLDDMPELRRRRITLMQGALTYRDRRMQGFDAACVVEVIEHMDVERLPAFEQVLFGQARPGIVIVTTPNRDYNALFPNLPAHAMRHPDHRFEWDRATFSRWARDVAQAYGYTVAFEGIGPVDPTHGTPTQMALFTQAGHES